MFSASTVSVKVLSAVATALSAIKMHVSFDSCYIELLTRVKESDVTSGSLLLAVNCMCSSESAHASGQSVQVAYAVSHTSASLVSYWLFCVPSQ